MNIPYKHILAVPARAHTVNAELMKLLAKQIEGCAPRHIALVSLPEGPEKSVLSTAILLESALKELGLNVTSEVRQSENPSFERVDRSDNKVRHIITTGLTPPPEGDMLVMVMDLEFAQKAPRILLWDFLEEHSINPDIDMFLRPGEAAIVDCKSRSRDTLHPEGYARWAMKIATGAI